MTELRWHWLLGAGALLLLACGAGSGTERADAPEATPAPVGWLGFGFEYHPPKRDLAEPGWLLVRGIVPDGPVESGGLKAGDVIARLNGVEPFFTSHLEALGYFAALAPGDELRLGVLRGVETLEITVQVARPPEGSEARWSQNRDLAAKQDTSDPRP